jgi:integrase
VAREEGGETVRRRKRSKDSRIYRRGGIWWCRIPHRHSTGCADEASASAVADQCERRIHDPTYAAASKATLGGCLKMLAADLVRRGRSQATQKKAGQKVGHFVRLWGEGRILADIGAPLVTEYIDARQKDGAAAITIKDELGHLRQALRLARYEGVYHLDPSTIFPPFFSSNHKPRKRWPTPEEVAKLLVELEPHRGAHVVWMLGTGSRLGESYRARREDVDFAARLVRIRGTKTDASDGTVPLTAINEPLVRWAVANASFPGTTLLFRTWGNLIRDLAAACARAGIDKLTPNDLRRGFGTWHRLAGVSVENVSLMLRHTTDKLAQTTYARVRGDEVRMLVEPQVRDVPALMLPKTSGATETGADEACIVSSLGTGLGPRLDRGVAKALQPAGDPVDAGAVRARDGTNARLRAVAGAVSREAGALPPPWVLDAAPDVDWPAILARRAEAFDLDRAVEALTTEAA